MKVPVPARVTNRGPSERPDPARRIRAGSSMQLPWALGLLAFSLVALAVAAFVGRVRNEEAVRATVLEQHEFATTAAAQSLRRSVNEGVDDLIALAHVSKIARWRVPDPGGRKGRARAGGPNPRSGVPPLNRAIEGLREIHQRYSTMYVLNDRGDVVARAGGVPHPEALRKGVHFERPGMEDAVASRLGWVIPQFAPIESRRGGAAVVAHYDPTFLDNPLQALAPSNVWLVNGEGAVLAALGDAKPGQIEANHDLGLAADRAISGKAGAFYTEPTPDEVVAYAAVKGFGPAGRLGWGLVSALPTTDLLPAQEEPRRLGAVLGIVLILLTAWIFGWLWLRVLRPLDRLDRIADQAAYGDFVGTIDVGGAREIASLTRSIERLRARVVLRGPHPGRRTSDRVLPEEPSPNE